MTMIFETIGKAKKLTNLSYLSRANSSAKMLKNKKVNQHTVSLYLAPANQSGYNTCPNSTPECRLGCLNTSGRAGMEIIVGKTTTASCRNRKTQLLFEHKEFFMNWLVVEINTEKQVAQKNNFDFSIRLNCTSDIDWSKIYLNGKNIFEIFPDVQFYDYTKNPKKFENKPNNCHLTMSYTGRNWNVCKVLLNKGFNVAVVFDTKKEKQLPTMFNGFKVIDGDITDYRPYDEKGCIVGLRWKVIANKENEAKVKNSCFVVKEKDLTNVNKECVLLV